MYLPEINYVAYDDFIRTLLANRKQCKGMYVYGTTIYNSGNKMAVLAYGPGLKTKELVGMEVVKKNAK